MDYEDLVQFVSVRRRHAPVAPYRGASVQPESLRWNFPTIDDLNEDPEQDFDWTGIEETTAEDRSRLD